MDSHTEPEFFELLNALPEAVQKQARAAFELFKQNPYHTSLQFKRVGSRESVYSARVGQGYCALGRRVEKDLIVWFWIGPHGEYDHEIKKY